MIFSSDFIVRNSGPIFVSKIIVLLKVEVNNSILRKWPQTGTSKGETASCRTVELCLFHNKTYFDARTRTHLVFYSVMWHVCVCERVRARA